MKKMSQKMMSLAASLTFILIGIMPIYAQNPVNGVVIIDDVSTIHDTQHRSTLLIETHENVLTFKNNRFVGHASVKIQIKETGTRRVVKEVTGNIVNGYFFISNVDISMLALDKTYDVNTYFSTQLPEAHGVGRPIQIKRTSKR